MCTWDLNDERRETNDGFTPTTPRTWVTRTAIHTDTAPREGGGAVGRS